MRPGNPVHIRPRNPVSLVTTPVRSQDNLQIVTVELGNSAQLGESRKQRADADSKEEDVDVDADWDEYNSDDDHDHSQGIAIENGRLMDENRQLKIDLEEASMRQKCCICVTHDRNTLILDCGHICVYHKSIDHLMRIARQTNTNAKCPLCRSAITGFMKGLLP